MKISLRKLLEHASLGIDTIPEMDINGIAIHTDSVKPGFLYIAIKGNLADGHDYLLKAQENGAVACIVEKKDVENVDIPIVRVPNTRRVASLVADTFYGSPSKKLNVIGITGTNGKTTTASILKNILTKAGFKTAQMGTLGTIASGHEEGKTLTTLDAVKLQKTFSELYNDGFTHVVMEVSSHSLHQYRVADVDFNIAGFTNLTPEHLDYHGTMEDYFYSKLKLFTTLPITSTAVVNLDDPYGIRIKEKCLSPVVSCSISSDTDVSYGNYEISLDGISGNIIAGDHIYDFETTLTGSFNLENILLAVSISYVLGLDPEIVKNGLKTLESIPGRFETFNTYNGGTVIVDYAHTPDAYEKVLSTIRNLNSANHNCTVLFGAGGNRDHTKRPIMASIAEKYSDRIVLTPDNPRKETLESINAEILTGLKRNNYKIFDDRGEGIRFVLNEMKQNEILVILGKGRENYQEIGETKFPYSDIEVIQEFINEN